MNKVILTVGPRGAGKSQFVQSVADLDSSIALVSRDAILMKLYGEITLDPYSDAHQYAAEKMWETLQEVLERSMSVRLLLDAWNGTSVGRRQIIHRLRRLGAEQIIAWYFETPIDLVERWFWNKPGIAKFSQMSGQANRELTYYPEDAPRRDHELFHSLAAGIDYDGFDSVLKIHPLQMTPAQALLSL